jgi:ribosomal protein L3 glutamine methyltransferase
MIDYGQALTELKTIRDILRFATTQFNSAQLYYGHGTDNAWDEAVALIMGGLHLPFDSSNQILDARLTTQERQHLLELIKRRVETRTPVPYLTQEAWFAGMPFYVDERVLIPRSPIAELIEQQFTPWILPEQVNAILDLCTGSGCIAIACAAAFADAEVDAVDLSEDALAVAQHNIDKHQLQQQVNLFRSDLFSTLPAKRYDIIVSNPPYVASIEMQTLPTEYRHEPEFALEAADDGLAVAHKILAQAADYLTEQGILVVEVGNSEVALVERYPEVPFTWLDFERGGHGVFLLTAEQVKQYRCYFR